MKKLLIAALVPIRMSQPVEVPQSPNPVLLFQLSHSEEFKYPVQMEMANEIVKASYVLKVPVQLMLSRCWNESRFYPNVKGMNYTSDGRHWSTDWGVCQVNDYWTPEVLNKSPKEMAWLGVIIMRRNFVICKTWKGADRRYATGRCN